MDKMRPAFRRLVASVVVASLLLTPLAASAQSCDPSTEARLQYLEARLDEGQANSKLWWRSWMAVFVIGLGFKTTTGAMRGDRSNAAADFIAAGKSGLGIAELSLRSHLGRFGAERVRAIPKTSPERCAERLRLAEDSLESIAKDDGGRWSWARHLSSLLLNLGAGLATAEGWDDEDTGWRDFAVSEASSELNIWTHPTRGVGDWAEYRHQFDGAPSAENPRLFRLAATRGGLGFVWKF